MLDLSLFVSDQNLSNTAFGHVPVMLISRLNFMTAGSLNCVYARNESWLKLLQNNCEQNQDYGLHPRKPRVCCNLT